MSVPSAGARFKRFPPRSGPVLIPTAHRGAARTALSLFGASRPAALLVQRLAWTLARLWGARVVPGPAVTWEPREAADEWPALLAEWSRRIGSFDHLALHERRQTSRAGVGVLLLDGERSIAFVKARVDDEGALGREERVLTALGSGTPRVLVPAVIGSGRLGHWSWLATSALPRGLHRPADRLPSGGDLSLLHERLRTALGGPPQDAVPPDHWRPMHGDLAPWNLRRLRDGRLAVLDWEDASWGPPGADEVYFKVTSAVVRRHRLAGEPAFPEALAYWDRVIRARVAAASEGPDRLLGQRLLAALETWRTRADTA